MTDRDWNADWGLCLKAASAIWNSKALPYWLQRARELEAQAAVMREALERAGEVLLDPVYFETIPDWITKALTAEAGKEMLERMRKLEEENRKLRAVAEEAKRDE